MPQVPVSGCLGRSIRSFFSSKLKAAGSFQEARCRKFQSLDASDAQSGVFFNYKLKAAGSFQEAG